MVVVRSGTTYDFGDGTGGQAVVQEDESGNPINPAAPVIAAGSAYIGQVGAQGVSTVTTATIANGANDSAAVDISAARAVGLEVPSTFDGSVITFKVATASGGTYQVLRDINNEVVTMTVQASTSYDLPGELTAWPFMKVVATTAQTGATDLVVVAKS